MSMSVGALKTAIKSAMLANIPSPTSEQVTAIDTTAQGIAVGIVTCVSSLSITYTAGLFAPTGGGPVTGDLSTCVIS